MDQLEEKAKSENDICTLETKNVGLQASQSIVLQDDKIKETGDKQMESIFKEKESIVKVTNDQESKADLIATFEDINTETELHQAVLNQQPLKVPTEAKEVVRIDKTENGTITKSQNTATTLIKHGTPTNCYTEVAKEVECDATINSGVPKQLEEHESIRHNLEQKIEQLTIALTQKENMISLYQRENAIIEKEKQAFRKEKDVATKEKEDTVIKFAIKEKLLIDAKKEKEAVEKLLAEARKEIRNATVRFQALNAEKSRMVYIIDEKCNEVRKYQRECEKLKTDNGHLESKLKYHINKLNMELETRTALEKKLEEERNAPNKVEEKALEQLKIEHEANTILLRHEISHKTEQIENLTKEYKKSMELIQELREQLENLNKEKTNILNDFEVLQKEHTAVQGSLSDEMLNSAKLRGQLEELQVLRTQNALKEEKIQNLHSKIQELEETIEYNTQDLQELHSKEVDLLSINKEISESIVNLQNDLCLLKSKMQGVEAENKLLKKEQAEYTIKYESLEQRLQNEMDKKSEERQLLTKHLSEKTKLYETTKMKLENILGDFEATNHKHATVVKELQREIQKYKKMLEQAPRITTNNIDLVEKRVLVNSQANLNEVDHHSKVASESDEFSHLRTMSHSSSSNQSNQNLSNSRRPSECSDAETTVVSNSNMTTASGKPSDLVKGPSKKQLVERILRLQQASARQTEKIDFLENHTLSLVAELQKKSKVVQYYMLRDQAGALTSTKSDQHKSELSKYGNGVMSAIYGGIKADNKSMTLELSLEINKKLQAVLEDTLLKNITLKENLDVLGIEVDNLTRKLRHLETKA